jgi:hypothetical protein
MIRPVLEFADQYGRNIVVSLCMMQAACSSGPASRENAVKAAALKTCNNSLRSRFDGKSTDIPIESLLFDQKGNTVVLRWQFRDGQVVKSASCKTSSDGRLFVSAQVEGKFERN